ncbi:MAG: 4Fe-4S cluster-binding domain-containing protein [Sutterellaceae bacterium]|nr:4Fe-4S cluster-binding domain-containing protein [Sutterellaceae bacterium]
MLDKYAQPTEDCLQKIYLMLGPACNLKCRHCYETDQPMPKLNKVIHADVWDYLSRCSERSKTGQPMKLVFWGGEPLLYWKLIVEVVERMGDDAFDYWIMSNGVLLTDDKVDFINAHGLGYSVSCDGKDTAIVRGVNILDDDAFCERFKRIQKHCVGATTHAYNIDPYALFSYVRKRVGEVPIHYQYTLECTFNMDADLYAYDFKKFEANLRRCRMNYMADYVAGNLDTAARYCLKRGVMSVERWLKRQEAGLPDEWYPECLPMRKDINVDILGFVHACHNRASVIGRVTDSYAELLEANDKIFRDAIAKKPECESCEVNSLCRHGCPLNPMSEGQAICCEAEKLYWNESLKTVRDARMQGVRFVPQRRNAI